MLQLFRNQEPRSLIYLLILLLISRLPWLVLDIPLPADINSLPAQFPDGILLLISMALIYVQAIWINYIFTQAHFLEQRTMVPAALWILITLLDNGFMTPGSPLILSFVVTALMYTLMAITQEEATAKQTFNAGILTGIGAAIHSPFILFTPFLLAGLYNLKTFRLREYFISLLGLAVPLLWAWSYFYLTDGDFMWWKRLIKFLGIAFFEYNLYLGIAVGVIVLYSIGGIVATAASFQSSGFQRKKNVRTTFILLGGLSLVFLLSKSWPLANSLLLLPPVTLLISILLLRIPKRIIAEILFGIFALTLLLKQILSSIT